MRTFWTGGESESEVLSSSMEAHFDFDRQEDGGPASHRWAGTSLIFRVRRRCRRGRYPQALLSILVRTLLAGLLRWRAIDGRAVRGSLSSRPRQHRRGHPRRAGIFPAAVDPPESAASSADAGAAQSGTLEVREGAPSRPDRSLLAVVAGVPAVRWQLLRHEPPRFTASPRPRAPCPARQSNLLARSPPARSRPLRGSSQPNGDLDDRSSTAQTRCGARLRVRCSMTSEHARRFRRSPSSVSRVAARSSASGSCSRRRPRRTPPPDRAPPSGWQ